MDEIHLKAEPAEEMGVNAAAALAAEIDEWLKVKTNLRFNIEIAKPGALPRYTLKARRFKDLREK